MARGGGGVGEEIFNRTKAGYESDFLDDSALITAFDNAINPIKAMLGDTQLTDIATKKGSHLQPKKKKKHKKNRNKSRQSKSSANCVTKWRIGSQCRCKYSEDGLVYDATIISIDDNGETCTVRYDYYNNEEQQQLSDLLLPPGASDSCQQSSSMQSDLESVDDAECMQNVQEDGGSKSSFLGANRQHPHKSRSSNKQRPNRLPPFTPPAFPFPYMPPFPSMPPPFSHPPPAFTHMPPMSSSFHRAPPSFQRLSGAPLIPPPPPPMMLDDSTECDKEALYSMLISWYMSGYHTGYYEGLKRRNQRPPAADDDDDDDEDGNSTSAETASSVKEHR